MVGCGRHAHLEAAARRRRASLVCPRTKTALRTGERSRSSPTSRRGSPLHVRTFQSAVGSGSRPEPSEPLHRRQRSPSLRARTARSISAGALAAGTCREVAHADGPAFGDGEPLLDGRPAGQGPLDEASVELLHDIAHGRRYSAARERAPGPSKCLPIAPRTSAAASLRAPGTVLPALERARARRGSRCGGGRRPARPRRDGPSRTTRVPSSSEGLPRRLTDSAGLPTTSRSARTAACRADSTGGRNISKMEM